MAVQAIRGGSTGDATAAGEATLDTSNAPAAIGDAIAVCCFFSGIAIGAASLCADAEIASAGVFFLIGATAERIV
ncbi:hypothetical protein CCAX7_57690 [Capsulimonas corticalis]|uniref:Uncharacterized protein n=1 Tax=Capsulimonas corticalis TaxID=2219043 RepID=A0A402D051_9BACT|nr:hypothetical protein CCAX7_57690 [Capsulimonas corticalis]